jgi:hypothetical protein
MTRNLVEGHWYQFVDGTPVWLGTVANHDVGVHFRKHVQLVGRIKEHCGAWLGDDDWLADELTSTAPHPDHDRIGEIASF